jgi:RNA polymerase sigma-70 factor (ECF subfamily)
MIRLGGDGPLGRDVLPGRSGDNPGSMEIANGSDSPSVALEKKERKELLQRVIDSLPESQRTALVLRDVEGLSYEEIGRILGLSLGTVKSRIARAREQLKSILRGIL